jgi:hypothetical protein
MALHADGHETRSTKPTPGSGQCLFGGNTRTVKLIIYRSLEILFGLLAVACIFGIWYYARRYDPWLFTADESLRSEEFARHRLHLCGWGVGPFTLLAGAMALLAGLEKRRRTSGRSRQILLPNGGDRAA